jgi:hypothetical protein
MDIFGKQEGLVINLDNITKSHLSDVSDKIIKNVMDGNEDAIQQYIKAKGLSELASQVLEGLKDEAVREAEKYGNDVVISGCKVQIKNTPTSYDFSHDSEWSIINNDIEKLKAELKAREKKMLDAMNYSELVDDSGEIIPPAQVKKSGGQTLAITIPV